MPIKKLDIYLIFANNPIRRVGGLFGKNFQPADSGSGGAGQICKVPV